MAVGSVSQFAIKFAIGVFLIVVLMCCCVCTSLITKVDDQNEKHFEISKYTKKYDSDKKEFEAMLKKQSEKSGDLKSKVCQSNEEVDIEAVNGTDHAELKKSKWKCPSKPDIKKRYLLFTFDNLTPLLNPSSLLSTDDVDPYDSLNNFVNVVIDNCNSKDTEVLLIISSPGGYAFRFERSYSDLMRLRSYGFHITALIDTICASGGYMLACGCNRIICSPYAQIGSVGVITKIHNYSKMIDKIGIEEKTFSTGKYKAGFPQGAPYTQEDVDITNELVDDTLVSFKQIVHAARPNANIEELLTARVWYGSVALEKHVVDENCLTTDDYLSKLAKNESNEIFIVDNYEKPSGLSGALSNLVRHNSVFHILQKSIRSALFFVETLPFMKKLKSTEYVDI